MYVLIKDACNEKHLCAEDKRSPSRAVSTITLLLILYISIQFIYSIKYYN